MTNKPITTEEKAAAWDTLQDQLIAKYYQEDDGLPAEWVDNRFQRGRLYGVNKEIGVMLRDSFGLTMNENRLYVK